MCKTSLNQAERELVERWLPLTLANLAREYPNYIAHQLFDGGDVAEPRVLTPAFFGSYDWHSAVHAHWQLVRILRCLPDSSFKPAIAAALDRSLTQANIAGELAYLAPRAGFERPYGLAWLLQLAAELREAQNLDSASVWLAALEPLENLAAERLQSWLPRLPYPVRTGLHNQTAFALALFWDWGRAAGRADVHAAVAAAAERFFTADVAAPLAYEPSGTDFLSPALAEADLLRRIWPAGRFAAWLDRFLPQIPTDGSADWLRPVVVPDPEDGRLAHLAGLNLSRAWMLAGIAAGLPGADARRAALEGAAAAHRPAGLAYAAHEGYMLSHWLPTFALYLLTGRGLAASS